MAEHPEYGNLVASIPAQADGLITIHNPVSGQATSITAPPGTPLNLYYKVRDTMNPGPALPSWYPPDSQRVVCNTETELIDALLDMDGEGGIIEAASSVIAENAINKILEASYGGREDNRLVLVVPSGFEYNSPLVSLRRDPGDCLAHVCINGGEFDGLDNSIELAIKLHGAHHHITFMNQTFRRWVQVFEFKDAVDNPTDDDRPHDIEFVNFKFVDIWRVGHGKLTKDDNRKGQRQQAGFWQGKRFSFRHGTLERIGWNPAGDPNRMYLDPFSHGFYGGQFATDSYFEDIRASYLAGNVIQHKGTRVEIHDVAGQFLPAVVSLGTNENQQGPCSATIRGVTGRNLVRLSYLDDPSLPSSEQVGGNSGVVLSLVNCENCDIEDVLIADNISGRRGVAVWIGNDAKDQNQMHMRGITIDYVHVGLGCRLTEVRDVKLPPEGMDVQFTNVRASDGARALDVKVNNYSPDHLTRRQVVAGMTINGQPVNIA